MVYVILHREGTKVGSGRGDRALGRALNHKNVLAAGRVFIVIINRAADGRAVDVLVELGKLTAERDPALRTEDFLHIGKGSLQLMGSFVKNYSAVVALQGFKTGSALLFVGREEALEAKSSRGQTRKSKSQNCGTSTGNTRNGDATSGTEGDYILTRVADGRRACVGNESAGFTCRQSVADHVTVGALVVLKVGDHRLLNTEIGEQAHRVSSVLSGDEIHLAEHLYGACGDVGEVADGSGNEIE